MTRNSPELSARAREIALELTSWPSVTGTPEEAAFAHRLQEYLCLKGFDESILFPVDAGPNPRSNLAVLKRGRSAHTIVLTGHFDTVPYDDYGALADFALSSEVLTKSIISRLRQSGESSLALRDFESGDFLAGRGLLDMKAGLAAGLAAMEAYSGDASILFLAVCDEEETSAGARVAAPILKNLEKRLALKIKLIINLDAISDQGDGSSGRVVTYGSIGKLLLTAFVHGKQTHAGYPQDGVNAAYVAAELLTEFELSPLLSERTGKEVAAPPTALHSKDSKTGYNVTTPQQAWIYWNTMQHQRTASEVFGIAMDHARRAVDRAKARTHQGIDLISFAELRGKYGYDLPKQDASLNFPEQARLATLAMIESLGISKPTVVMGFGSIPYSAVSLRNESLRTTISEAVQPFGLGSVNYFAGISDMSFFGEASSDLSVVAANTPIWGTSFTLAEPAGYPCINIGPWGRDYHHWLERLDAPYAFETLPKVLLSVIDAVFKKG
ncbi:MAG: M20/M25/M40 family metallo-hydrolase [Aestuariivirga sp.]